MRSTVYCLAALCAASLGLAPAAGRADPVPAGSADQLLSALAAVVRDRAREVATETLTAELAAGLCSGDAILAGRARLRPGGSPACRADPKACDVDDVFVASCRLVSGGTVPLTDPYFLKALVRETIELAVRVSARDVERERYAELRLRELARYLDTVIATSIAPDATADDVLATTVELAGALASGEGQPTFADRLLRPAPGDPYGARLLAAREGAMRALLEAIVETCHPAQPVPAVAPGHDLRFCGQLLPLILPGGAIPAGSTSGTAGSCADYARARPARDAMFLAWFGDGAGAAAAVQTSPGAAAGGRGEFARARELDCATALADTPYLVRGCEVAQLWRVFDPLLASACDADAVQRSRTLRQLTYVLADWTVYASAAAALSPRASGALQGFRAAVDARLAEPATLAAASREELASALVTLATWLRARREDPKATAAWLEEVSRALSLAAYDGNVRILRTAPALVWEKGLELKRERHPALATLREHVRAMLAIPLLVGTAHGVTESGLRLVANALDDLVTAMAQAGDGKAPPLAVARRLARVLEVLASLCEAAAPLAPGEAERATLATYRASLGRSAALLQHASQRDWVGLAVEAAEELRAGDPSGPAQRALGFSRVVLAAYQARSVDDAKAVFESALDERSSRRARYAGWSADVAALVGARGGLQQSFERGRSPAYRNEGLGGLFAPVGFQLAWRGLGGMVYPVDLGAWLVATGGEVAPTSTDAVRAGAALYWRTSERLPIVLGAALDYRPRVERRTELRGSAFVALELPLYFIR